ncbi:MAG: AfsR/SARP family transcriptional regulator, partial [Streptomycetaceae bacterium]|nr:AfsR/SARP family transcriptional regulator [Streptomycetaceae bacterium]
MEARILGPLEVVADGHGVVLATARKPRLMLAALLAHAGQALSIETLTGALWEGSPPVSARRNIQLYAHQLRRMLGGATITGDDRGYVYTGAESVDATLFRRYAERGRKLWEVGEPAAAAQAWRAALDLWRGPALAEFPDSALLAEEARRLEDLRLDVRELWAQSQLAVGDTGAVLAEVTPLAHAHPFRESLCGLLMRALYRCGRQAEALEAYRRTRRHLAEQLGIEPGPELQQLHAAILRRDELLLAAPSAPITAGPVPPAQLPAGPRDFTGRAAALASLDALLALAGEPEQVLVAAVTGMPGVGKSGVAV